MRKLIGIMMVMMFFSFMIVPVGYCDEAKYISDDSKDMESLYKIKGMMNNILDNYVGSNVSREELKKIKSPIDEVMK